VKLRDRDSGAQLYHFNTHFDHEGQTARLKSAKLLQRRIDELAPDTPVVLTGDFNCRRSSPPYEQLTRRTAASEGRKLRDTRVVTTRPHHGPETTMTDFQNLVPAKKIDHVFVTNDVVVDLHGVCSDTYADGRYPSDHLPVLVKLLLSNPAEDREATDSRELQTFYRTDSIRERLHVPTEDDG
jgi:endonuclease/exonuclease/phosphatase family metal-dependent hydrolase